MVVHERKNRIFARREEEILDAALILFSEPNWSSVSIDKIAAKADIGKGTVYKHFSSKDELLFRLMLRFYTGLFEHLKAEHIDSESVDFLAHFRHLLGAVFNYHLQNSHYRYVVEHCNSIDFKQRAEQSWRDSFLMLDQAFSQLNQEQMNQAMEVGTIEKRSIDEIHLGLRACFDGAVNMLWASKDWCSSGSAEDIISMVTNFMIAGLKGAQK